MAQDSVKVTIAICDGFNLILPSSMVADVVSGVSVINIDDPKNWQRGNLIWQGDTIPVVAFEQMIRDRKARLRGSHIAVLRGTTDTDVLPYYGLPTQAMPSEYVLETQEETISEIVNPELKLIASAARVRGVPCVIPEVVAIEEHIIADIKSEG